MKEKPDDEEKEIVSYTIKGNVITPQIKQWNTDVPGPPPVRIDKSAEELAEEIDLLDSFGSLAEDIHIGFDRFSRFVPADYHKFREIVIDALFMFGERQLIEAGKIGLGVRAYVEKDRAVLRIGKWNGVGWEGTYAQLDFHKSTAEDVLAALWEVLSQNR